MQPRGATSTSRKAFRKRDACGDARDAGVDRSVSLGEGLLFGFDADSLRRKARNAHFEVQEFHPRLCFHDAGYVARLADRGLRDVGYVHPLQCGAQAGPVERYFHGFVCFWAAS